MLTWQIRQTLSAEFANVQTTTEKSKKVQMLSAQSLELAEIAKQFSPSVVALCFTFIL